METSWWEPQYYIDIDIKEWRYYKYLFMSIPHNFVQNTKFVMFEIQLNFSHKSEALWKGFRTFSTSNKTSKPNSFLAQPALQHMDARNSESFSEIQILKILCWTDCVSWKILFSVTSKYLFRQNPGGIWQLEIFQFLSGQTCLLVCQARTKDTISEKNERSGEN